MRIHALTLASIALNYNLRSLSIVLSRRRLPLWPSYELDQAKMSGDKCHICQQSGGHALGCSRAARPADRTAAVPPDSPSRPKRKAAAVADVRFQALHRGRGGGARGRGRGGSQPSPLPPTRGDNKSSEHHGRVEEPAADEEKEEHEDEADEDDDGMESSDDSDDDGHDSHVKSQKAEIRREKLSDEKAYPGLHQGKPRTRFRVLADLAYRLNPSMPRTRVNWNEFQLLNSVAGWILLILQEQPTIDQLSDTCIQKNHLLMNFQYAMRKMAPTIREEHLLTLCGVFRFLNAIMISVMTDDPMEDESIESMIIQFSEMHSEVFRNVFKGTMFKMNIKNPDKAFEKHQLTKKAAILRVPVGHIKDSGDKKNKKRFENMGNRRGKKRWSRQN